MVYLNRNAAAEFRTSNTVAQIKGDFQDQLDQIIPPSGDDYLAAAPPPPAPSYDLGNDPLTTPDMAGSQPAASSPSQPEPAAPPPAASAPPASSFTPPGMAPVSYDGGQPAPQPALSNSRGRDLATNQFAAGLSYADALAACGLTAAQALARAYGNDIPIDQVLAAARQNGWTQDGGMNGIQNQKRLMDQLGIPSRLDTAPDWGAITRDAQSGNPVIISTTKHYYVLSDYDAQSGKFYVGETGLAFKNGSKWMSLSEIQNQGNGINGALFADAPTSPTPSVAAKPNPTSAQDWQSHFSGVLEGALSKAGDAANAVGQAKDQAVKSAADWSADFGQMLDSSLSQVEQSSAPQQQSAAPIQDNVPGYVRDYAAANGSQAAENPYVGEQPVPASTQSPLDVLGQVKDAALRPGALLPNVADSVQNSGFWGPNDQTRQLAEGSVSKQIFQHQPLTPEEQQARQDYTTYVGGMASPVNKSPAASPNKIIDGLISRFDDRNIGLRRYEQETAKLIGRELQTDEQASVLSRLAADPAAKVKVDEGLKPAIQSVQKALGDQGFDDFAELVTVRSNVDAAKTLSQRAAQVAMNKPITQAPGTAEALSAARSLDALRQSAAKRTGLSSTAQAAINKKLTQAENRYARALEKLDPAIQDALNRRDVAAFDKAQKVWENRQFSGGITADESLARMRQLEQDPTVKAAADQVSAYVGTLRDRLVKAGVWSQEFADQMKQQYPHWAPTRILDYMSDEGGQRIGGKGLSLRDSGLRHYTEEGTARLRQNPIESLVDYTFQVERMARKNEAAGAFKAADDLRPATERVLRKVTSAYKPTADEATFEFFENGVKQRFVAPKIISDAINGASVMPVPEWMGKYGDFVRAAVTQRNPVFLAGNAALDIPEYLLTSYTAEGANPLAAPKILWEMAKGYKSAFDGILTGEFKGAAAEMMKSGAGQSGVYQAGNKAAKQTVEGLRRANAVQVKSKADLARLTKNILTLKPVEGLGERIEQGPRIAAMNLAKQRGENAAQAAIRAREVTIDFSRGGTVTKYINSFVPFFNVAFQGPSKVMRTVKGNPVVASLTIGQLIGLPTVLAEAWNNADPQRAEDYKNVSDYYKRTGVVIMLDGTTDADGNRIPQFVHINMRNWAGFVQIARQAANVAGIGTPEEWGKLLLDTGSAFLPTGGSNAADLANSLTTPVPGLGTASQLTTNKDVFRGTDIATKANDARAGGTARAITDVVNSAMAPFTANRIRPSQVDFAIKDAAPGVGATALGMGDFAFGGPQDKRSTPSDIPLAGGVIGRFVKAGGNQQLYDAKDNVLSPKARQVLEAAGVDYTPAPMADTAYKADLTNTEQAKAQQLANQYVNEAILRLPDNARFQALNPDQRRQAVLAVVDAAKQQARDELVQGMTRELPRPEGQPPKYLGVGSYAREVQIDQAISAYNAWQADRRNAPMPTAQEITDARIYGRQINPLYTRWAQQNRAESASVRSVGAPAPRGATTVLAPAPTR